jgi:UDP-N-acetylmuramoyl-L-alanyl-D-glutamate--2,6-diaminopimelate ligase
MTVTLGELAHDVGGTLHGDATVVVSSVHHDSRVVDAGALFVAVPGGTVDGARFAEGAVGRGAVAVVAERRLDLDVPQLVVDDARRALALVSELVYRRPTRELAVVGITGTNGKTTTAYMVEGALTKLGAAPAMMGTVAWRGPGFSEPAIHTTPEADDAARFARRAVDTGATHLVMEVSSHALAMHRVDGVTFEVAAFTNLTQDHLDYHGDFHAYGEAKARLFVELAPRAAVVNIDDDFGARLATRLRGSRVLLRCSTHAAATAELRVTRRAIDRHGIRATVSTPEGEVALESPLVGAHNLENLLVALGIGMALGHPPGDVSQALKTAAGAPGRLERVDDPRDVAVFVDYAHTPDALTRALAALRPTTPGRLLVVFGCGGDRDRGKRPLMGAAAARGADLCIVTSDNPRTEDPRAIIDAIVPGVAGGGKAEVGVDALPKAPSGWVAVVDRALAIATAVQAARAGDTLLIAGKGHEDYQIVGTEKRGFDDRVVAREAIAAVGGEG